MECNKVLLDSVNSAVRRSMGKAVIALLVVLLCSSLIAPAVLLGAVGNGSGIIFSALFAAAAVIFLLIIQFGFTILLVKLYRGSRAVLGDLFCGFRDFKRVCIVSVIFGIAVAVICSIIVSAGTAIFLSSGQAVTTESMLRLVPILTVVCVIVYWFLIMLPYAFVYFVLYDNPLFTVRQVFKTALNIMRGHRMKFLGFVFRVGGWWLLIAVAAYAGAFLLTDVVSAAFLAESRQRASAILGAARLLDVVYFVCSYMSLIRITMGCAAYYDALLADRTQRPQQNELPFQQEPPALPDMDGR